MKSQPFIVGLLFSYFVTIIKATTDDLVKRQVVASPACARLENTQGICSPSSSSVWYNGTYQELTWKYNNPNYMTSEGTVNVHLLYMIDNEYTSIKNWTNQPLQPGTIVQLIDDTWFPSLLPENSANKTWEPYVYVITNGHDYREEIAYDYNFPAPVQFKLIQNAPDTTSTSDDDNNTNKSENNNDSSGLKGWMIAVIVIACVLFVAALIALFWLFRRLRRNKAAAAGTTTGEGGDQRNLIQGKDGTYSSQMSSVPSTQAAIARPFAGSVTNASSVGGERNDMSSIHSSTPIVHHAQHQRVPSLPQSPSSPKSTTAENFENKAPTSPAVAQIMQQQEARQSSSILSSTDAIMIADTFRQFMRKPEWNEHHDEEDEEAFKSSQQWSNNNNNSDERKRVGDELLRKELAQEGTSVQQIERRSPSRLKDDSMTTNNDDDEKS
ncbi:hypothetical protein INT45_004723 [Circinella minor]|uniref:Mid2 domain-containing protein n=1 Tax=Circinella minor TaxID=1195481 RepID=A0A8H7SEK6_9FUNG|nr:hypothetical protein INT45_004723 [Circinella minor]